MSYGELWTLQSRTHFPSQYRTNICCVMNKATFYKSIFQINTSAPFLPSHHTHTGKSWLLNGFKVLSWQRWRCPCAIIQSYKKTHLFLDTHWFLIDPAEVCALALPHFTCWPLDRSRSSFHPSALFWQRINRELNPDISENCPSNGMTQTQLIVTNKLCLAYRLYSAFW